jgi:hypothetical protein
MSDTSADAIDSGVSQVDADLVPDEYDVLEVVAMHASMTAIGTVTTEEFEASQSLIGAANIDGDGSLSGCCIGMLSAESVGIHQGAAGVMVVDGDASVDQGGAVVLVAGTAGVEQGGVGVLVASEANLARSWVGFMAARNATLTDDSRVVIDARGALIIGGLLFGGLGLVAFAVFMAGKRIAERMPRMPRLPHLPQMPQVHMPHLADLPKMSDMPKLPDLSGVLDMVAKLRRTS